MPEFDFMLIGAAFYHDRYRRTPDGWKISATGYDRTYEATMSLKALDFKLNAGRGAGLTCCATWRRRSARPAVASA